MGGGEGELVKDLPRNVQVDHQTATSAEFYTGFWCLLSVPRPVLLGARPPQRYALPRIGSLLRLRDSVQE